MTTHDVENGRDTVSERDVENSQDTVSDRDVVDVEPRETAVFDGGLWAEIVAHLSKKRRETGGILLGHRAGGSPRFVAAVFPEQLMSSSVRCEFSASEIYRLRHALDLLEEGLGIDVEAVSILTWVHTHPNLGVFLSGTDLATLGEWAAVDHRLHAVVIDVYREAFEHQVGVFDATGSRLPTELDSIDLPVGLRAHIGQSIADAYADADLAPPKVLVGTEPEKEDR